MALFSTRIPELRASLTHPSPPPLSQRERGDSRLSGRGNLDAWSLPESTQKRRGSNPAPSGGRAESLRRGTSGMDAARGVRGHGWPLTPGPRSDDGGRGVRRSRTRMKGQALLVSFGATAKRDSPGGETETRSQLNNQLGSW